ncbi:MAG: hypothetical protein NTY35_03830 [Planctomycetota bacterium]|nr:hypothetical protein [Planctomycetota bacterium]
MEEKIFPRPAVAAELTKNFIEARLHTDGGPAVDRNKQLQQEMTRSVANPIYVVVDPKTGKPLRKKAGLIPEDKFLVFLRGPIN